MLAFCQLVESVGVTDMDKGSVFELLLSEPLYQCVPRLEELLLFLIIAIARIILHF